MQFAWAFFFHVAAIFTTQTFTAEALLAAETAFSSTDPCVLSTSLGTTGLWVLPICLKPAFCFSHIHACVGVHLKGRAEWGCLHCSSCSLYGCVKHHRKAPRLSVSLTKGRLLQHSIIRGEEREGNMKIFQGWQSYWPFQTSVGVNSSRSLQLLR